jgi:hypothetical protein
MAVSIKDRKWVMEEDGTQKEKVEFMLDSPSDISLLPDPSRISASSVATIKSTKSVIFIVNGAWFIFTWPGGSPGASFQRRTVQGDGTSTTFNVTGIPETARDFFFTLNSLSLDPPDYTWVFEGTGGTLTVHGFIPLAEDVIEIFYRS